MPRPPFEFEDPILQRTFEDAYKKISTGERTREEMLADLNSQMAELRKRILGLDKTISAPTNVGVLPIPQNLVTVKVGFFGIASVDAFKLTEVPGLLGYEFYSDTSSPVSPVSLRTAEGFNLRHKGPSPWCVYWCGLSEDVHYVIARTYGMKGAVSQFTAEASTDDKPDTPDNVDAAQSGDLYPVLGQMRAKIIVSWDAVDDPYIIGYDVRETLEP